jgi:hypothetical protein
MPLKSKNSAFPSAATTSQKINVTSLTLTLANISKDETIGKIATTMINSLYSKTQDRALKRASALLALLRAHD